MKQQLSNIILTGSFLMFIFLISFYIFLTEDIEKSEVENRSLAQRPDLKISSVLSGEFMENFENFITDQFPNRNAYLRTYFNFQRMIDRTYVYNFLITDDDWIIPRPNYDFPKMKLDQATENLNQFGEYLSAKGIEFYYISVPHRSAVIEFLLPSHIPNGNELKNNEYFFSKIDSQYVKSLNLLDYFLDNFSEEELKDFYFKTDHHWNVFGALEGYKNIEDFLQKDSSVFPKNTSKVNFEIECLPNNYKFDGSLNKQIYYMIQTEENMCYLNEVEDAPLNISVYQSGKETTFSYIYARAKRLPDTDPINYSFLTTFNYKELTIFNEDLKEDQKKILIIKDSYANFYPLLFAQRFYQTTFYDQRYNSDRTLVEYIDENDFDIVMIIYNSNHITGPNYNFFDLPVD